MRHCRAVLAPGYPRPQWPGVQSLQGQAWKSHAACLALLIARTDGLRQIVSPCRCVGNTSSWHVLSTNTTGRQRRSTITSCTRTGFVLFIAQRHILHTCKIVGDYAPLCALYDAQARVVSLARL